MFKSIVTIILQVTKEVLKMDGDGPDRETTLPVLFHIIRQVMLWFIPFSS